MRSKQHLAIAALSVASLCGAAPVSAAPAEPLVVERLADPDPNFVPPPPEPKQARARTNDNPNLEGAMQDLGRVIGQAALVEKQQAEARCKAGVPADATAEQRFAMEAACRYERH